MKVGKNTEIIAITDRSGSMQSIAKDVIGGYNRFIAEQKLVEGEAKVTFIQFDDKYELVYEAKSLKKVSELTSETYKPRASTALFDAIGMTLEAQGKRIHDEAWADCVIVTIITDGEENSSKEYTQDRIKEMITHAEKHGWLFVFLAANQDAFATGASFGISAGGTFNYAATSVGTRSAYDSMSLSTTTARTSSITT